MSEHPLSYQELIFPIRQDVFHRCQALGFGGLNEAQQTVLCIWPFVSEVENGSLDQFFVNSSGD
jgi:hypothetical protein